MEKGISNKLGKTSSFVAMQDGKDLFKLKSVKFILTRECNLKCFKCNIWKEKKLNQHYKSWTFEEIVDIIFQLHEIGVEMIHFSGGEVTLRDDLINIIQLCTNKSIKTKITTNGSLINESMAQNLVNSGISEITVSIDSADEKQHDYYTGVTGSLFSAMNALKYLNYYREIYRSSLKLDIVTVVYNSNYDKLNEIVNLSKSLNVKSICFLALIDFNLKSRGALLSNDELNHFNNTIKPILFKLGNDNDIDIEIENIFSKDEKCDTVNSKTTPCFITLNSLYIHAWGYIYPCCYLKGKIYRLGNLHKAKVKEILSSSNFQKLIEKYKEHNLFNDCVKCNNRFCMNEKIGKTLTSI